MIIPNMVSGFLVIRLDNCGKYDFPTVGRLMDLSPFRYSHGQVISILVRANSEKNDGNYQKRKMMGIPKKEK